MVDGLNVSDKLKSEYQRIVQQAPVPVATGGADEEDDDDDEDDV